jgi:hypothetical protein
VLLTPGQQVTFNGAIIETVSNLISGTTITLWNTEQLFQLSNVKVGYAPGAYLAS